MTEPTKLKLYVFSYIGNVVRGEFANVAICLVEISDSPDRFIAFDITRNWSRIQAFFPQADTAAVRNWCVALKDDVLQPGRTQDSLNFLESLSGTVSVSVQEKAMLTSKPPAEEMQSLVALYLD